MELTDEQQAALERWRAPGWQMSPDRYRDAFTLADAFVAMQDQTPIDEAWLKKMKFIQEGENWFANGLALTRICGDWRWQVGGEENMWELLSNPTRGTVRQLLAALGIAGRE